MVYVNRRVPNDPTLFPEPQSWMTWVADFEYDTRVVGGSYKCKITPKSDGKLRYYDSLAAARKSLAWIGSRSAYKENGYYEGLKSGHFSTDWAVYHWNGSEWEKVHEGLRGEARDDNPLFRRRFKKDEKVHSIDKKLEEAAIASILAVAP